MKSKPKTAAPRAKPVESRQVVHIAVGEGDVWLLCNDGTVWFGGHGNWTQADITTVLNAPMPTVEPEADQC